MQGISLPQFKGLPLVIVARLKAANDKKIIMTLFSMARAW